MDENRGNHKSANAISTLRDFLTSIGWEPEPTEDGLGFEIDFGPPHLPIASALAAISSHDQFVIYFNFGLAAPEDRRAEVAQFMVRANWNLIIGNFEMDYDDGLMHFRSSVGFAGGELTEVLLRNVVLSAMKAVEFYADGLLEVVSSRKNAMQAITDIQKSSN
jgi:hypothetical protein